MWDLVGVRVAHVNPVVRERAAACRQITVQR